MKCDTNFGIRKSHLLSEAERDITFADSIYGARSATDSSSLMKPIQKSQVVLVDIPENLVENDSIVAEHGLSSKITQSPGGSSDTSEGSENSGSFKDSGRSNEEYSEDGASSKEGSFETPHVRRSTRESRAPVRYSPSANYLLLTENGELESYSEALSSKEFVQWKKAINEEMVSLEKNQTWSLVILPDGERRAYKASQKRGFSASWAGRKPRVQIEGNSVRTDSSIEANGSDMAEFNKPKWVLIFVEDSWNEEPCSDVHQVGDEREIEVLLSFNWPPSEFITEDGVLPERGYSQFDDVSSGYLVSKVS
ncbi:retrovirus-related pol polyprotein from transposon TNT 1-94 [Tanacetum coccineum]